MPETFIDSIFNEAVLAIVLGSITGFGVWLKNIKKTQDTSCKRLWRLEKAFALFVKMQISQTKKTHPDADTSAVEIIIDELMEEQD